MRPDVVVIVAPHRQLPPGVSQAVEEFLIEQFITPRAVYLESEWVLRGGYGFDTEQIAAGLSGLAGLPGVFVEEPALLATAIDWMRAGMDFADALHLTKAGDCTAFLSFDKKLAKAAKGHSSVPVEAP